jgi:hypothetical protein
VDAKWVVTGSNGKIGISGAMDWAARTLLVLGFVIMGCNPRGDPRIEGLSR